MRNLLVTGRLFTVAVWYNRFMTWQVRDRYGNQIYMTAECWLHALEKRPWLADYLDDVLVTIRLGRRTQDPLNLRKYKYYRPCASLQPEFNHIVVVVLFKESANAIGQATPNNYVVNIWAVYMYGER